jgi:hypothetical protein
LRAIAAEEESDVILINETWCYPDIGNGELAIDGYQLDTDCRRDRSDTTNGIGGGLLVFTKIGMNTRTLKGQCHEMVVEVRPWSGRLGLN